VVWYYDNYKRISDIKNVITKFIFKGLPEGNKNNYTAYPDKMDVNNIKNNNTDTNDLIFIWNINVIKPNDYQKILIEMPLFNANCRLLVNNIF
jgi:hypothetical protein